MVHTVIQSYMYITLIIINMFAVVYLSPPPVLKPYTCNIPPALYPLCITTVRCSQQALTVQGVCNLVCSSTSSLSESPCVKYQWCIMQEHHFSIEVWQGVQYWTHHFALPRSLMKWHHWVIEGVQYSIYILYICWFQDHDTIENHITYPMSRASHKQMLPLGIVWCIGCYTCTCMYMQKYSHTCIAFVFLYHSWGYLYLLYRSRELEFMFPDYSGTTNPPVFIGGLEKESD